MPLVAESVKGITFGRLLRVAKHALRCKNVDGGSSGGRRNIIIVVVVVGNGIVIVGAVAN